MTPLAGKDLRLPVERQVIAVFGHQHMGERARAGAAPGDRRRAPGGSSRSAGSRTSGGGCATRARAPIHNPASRRSHAPRCHSTRRAPADCRSPRDYSCPTGSSWWRRTARAQRFTGFTNDLLHWTRPVSPRTSGLREWGGPRTHKQSGRAAPSAKERIPVRPGRARRHDRSRVHAYWRRSCSSCVPAC